MLAYMHRYIMDRAAQGWLHRVAMATRPRLHTSLSYMRFGSLLFAHHAYILGSAVGADTGRKIGPMNDLVDGDQRRSLPKPLIVQDSTVVILYFAHKGLN